MFNGLRKALFRKSKKISAQSSTVSSQEQVNSESQYIADQPITSKAEDRFNRAPFATRIAQTIVSRQDPTSIVIGLFGPWGDGKTSVLEMMQEAIEPNTNCIVIRFNPWHFQREELLLRGFFSTMADSLGKSLPNLKEKAGDLLSKYGGILSIASISAWPGFEFSPGDAAKSVGETMSNVGLDELRRRIENMLAESKKRLIILIDDIDRLDRDETHAIFKLVKLSASFRYTAYVLALDDKVVAASLGERYGAGGEAAGRAFLEKIIQVPLHLPPADDIGLRQLTFEGVDNALKQAQIELNTTQVDAFVRHYDDSLLSKIETPRRAKLYSNALLFALPILKGEVNPVDLMLLEGIRIFYPNLYVAIRENADLFLRGEHERRRNENDLDSVDSLIIQAVPGISTHERDILKHRLLKPLFPRIGNTVYQAEWDSEWSKEQKVCSNQYFKRYFTYSVPIGDIADSKIKDFCNSALSTSDSQMRTIMEEIASKQSFPRLIVKLRQSEETMSEVHARALIKAFAKNGDLLPQERGMLMVSDTRSRCGMLIARLLRQIQAGAIRQAEAEWLLYNSHPLDFGMECVRWIHHGEGRTEADRVLTDEGDLALYQILANRINDADLIEPLFLQFGRSAPLMYRFWSDQLSISEITTRLRTTFEANPDLMDRFLATYIGESWGMETGLSRPSDFERSEYDAVTRLLSGDYIVANLRERFGEELDDPQEYLQDSIPLARRIAHQFTYIHRYVLQQVTSS